MSRFELLYSLLKRYEREKKLGTGEKEEKILLLESETYPIEIDVFHAAPLYDA